MKPKHIAIVLVLVMIGAGIWYFNKPASKDSDSDDRLVPPSQQQSNQEGDTIVEEVPNALEGELQSSSDKRRGNLMLLLKDSDRVIYLNTSRDFSHLIGKQVSVSIEGSLDDFRLLDMKEIEP